MQIQIGEGPHRQVFEWDDQQFHPGPGRILFAAMATCLAGYCFCAFIGGAG